MNSNNLEKQKEKILTSFKQKRFQDVLINGEQLLNEGQNDAQLLYILGLSSINLQNFVNAEKYFKKLVLIHRSAENLYTLGNIQKKLKKSKDAIISLEEAIKSNPNFSEAYNNLANIQKSLKMYDKAVGNYKKAISLKENNFEAYFNLANLYYSLENYVEASNYFKNITNLNSRHEEICERYTICLFKTGKKNEVKDFVLSIISKYPSNKILNNLLGQSLLSLNSHVEGLSYIKKGAGFLQIDVNGVKLLS